MGSKNRKRRSMFWLASQLPLTYRKLNKKQAKRMVVFPKLNKCAHDPAVFSIPLMWTIRLTAFTCVQRMFILIYERGVVSFGNPLVNLARHESKTEPSFRIANSFLFAYVARSTMTRFTMNQRWRQLKSPWRHARNGSID